MSLKSSEVKCIVRPKQKYDKHPLPDNSPAHLSFPYGPHRWMYRQHHIWLRLTKSSAYPAAPWHISGSTGPTAVLRTVQMVNQTHQIHSNGSGTQQRHYQTESSHRSNLLWNFCSIRIINRTTVLVNRKSNKNSINFAGQLTAGEFCIRIEKKYGTARVL